MKKNILWGIIIILLVQIISPIGNAVQATTLKKYNEEELSNSNLINDFKVNEITLQDEKNINKKSLSIKEDVDVNGVVDILDLSLVSTLYNSEKADENYNESLDINNDGIIDIFDLINISKQVGSDPFLLAGTYEEDNSLIKYNGNWNIANNDNFSNNSIKFSDNTGDNIEFKFYGTGIEWYSLCSTSAGISDIYIDGTKIRTKDSYLWADYYNRIEFHKNDLELGIHTVRIENTGNKNTSSKGTNLSIDRIIVNNNSTGNVENNYTIYQQTNNGNLYVGQYPTLDDAIYHGNLYANMYAMDSEGNEVWTNSYKVYQDTVSGEKIFVGRYSNFDLARKTANNFRNSYIIDLNGQEVWRGKYELWQGDKFLNRYTTLEEAITYGKKNNNTIIKDIFNNNTIVWENKYTVYQVIETTQKSFQVAEYKTYDEALTKAKQFANTYIINGNNEEIWTNSYSAFQDTSISTILIGRYDNLKNAKEKAYWYKNAYVVDGGFKELWRARYEVYQAKDDWSTFLGRHNTLDEAIKQANEFDYTKIIDVVDGDDLVWSQGERIRSGHISTDGSNVDVRESNDINSAVIGTLTYSTKVEVIESWMDNWYKIKYKNTVGYVEKQYISLNPPKELPIVKTAYVNTGSEERLRIRQSTSLTSDIIGHLDNGDTVRIVSKVNNEWYRIRYRDGYGYVASKFISDTIPTIGIKYVNTSKLNVRTGPGTGYSIVGTLNYGDSVSIVTKLTGWYRIKYNGQETFVDARYISNSKPTLSPNNGGSTSTPITPPSQSNIDKAISQKKLADTKIVYTYNNTKYKVYYDSENGADFYRLSKVIFLKNNNVVETNRDIISKLMLLHYINEYDHELKQSLSNYKSIVNNYLSMEGSLIEANMCFKGIQAVVLRNAKVLLTAASDIIKDKMSIDTLIIGEAMYNLNTKTKVLEDVINRRKKGKIYNYNEIKTFGDNYEKHLNKLQKYYDIIADQMVGYNSWWDVVKKLANPTSAILDTYNLKIIKKALDNFSKIGTGYNTVTSLIDRFIESKNVVSWDVKSIDRNLGYTIQLINKYK